MARYLIDANLPRWFSLWAGADCEFVHDLGADWSDTKVWQHAAANALTKATARLGLTRLPPQRI